MTGAEISGHSMYRVNMDPIVMYIIRQEARRKVIMVMLPVVQSEIPLHQ